MLKNTQETSDPQVKEIYIDDNDSESDYSDSGSVNDTDKDEAPGVSDEKDDIDENIENEGMELEDDDIESYAEDDDSSKDKVEDEEEEKDTEDKTKKSNDSADISKKDEISTLPEKSALIIPENIDAENSNSKIFDTQSIEKKEDSDDEDDDIDKFNDLQYGGKDFDDDLSINSIDSDAILSADPLYFRLTKFLSHENKNVAEILSNNESILNSMNDNLNNIHKALVEINETMKKKNNK